MSMLRECGWCGSERLEVGCSGYGNLEKHAVVCMVCSARGPVENSRQGAVMAWNLRAPATEGPRPETQQLRGIEAADGAKAAVQGPAPASIDAREFMRIAATVYDGKPDDFTLSLGHWDHSPMPDYPPRFYGDVKLSVGDLRRMAKTSDDEERRKLR